MSTFERYASEKTSFTEDELTEKAQNLSITKDQEYPYTGIVRNSMKIIDGGFCFDYGKVVKEKEQWYDGSMKKKEQFDGYTVLFIDSGEVLIDSTCDVETKEEIIEFIETHFLERSSLVKVERGRKALNRIEKYSSKLHAMYSRPASEDSPEKQKASDKEGLRGTDYYESNIDEPLDKVKVQLPSAAVTMKVGIDKEGNITLYSQQLESQTELHAIKAILQDIETVNNETRPSVQTRLNSEH
jgi:hypothetical protein